MELPMDLPSRYSRVTDDGNGGPVMQPLPLSSSGVPAVPANELRETIARPGFIQWDDEQEHGVSFNLRPTRAQLKADQLDVSAMARGGYVKMTGEEDSWKVKEPKDVALPAVADKNPEADKKMSGYYVRGLAQTDAPAPAPTSDATTKITPAPVSAASDATTKKLLFLLAGLIIGIVAGRFATKREWI